MESRFISHFQLYYIKSFALIKIYLTPFSFLKNKIKVSQDVKLC